MEEINKHIIESTRQLHIALIELQNAVLISKTKDEINAHFDNMKRVITSNSVTLNNKINQAVGKELHDANFK